MADRRCGAYSWNALYLHLLRLVRRMYQVCRLVHADLSEYNILYHARGLYVIDVGQSVEHDHPRALEFLRMDVKNVTDFFRRKGVDVLSERAVFGFVVDPDVSDDGEVLGRLFENRPPEAEDREVDEKVFRRQYIPQTLQQVYDIERDGEKLKQGGSEPLVYQALLAEKGESGKNLEGSEAVEGSEDAEDEDEEDDSEGEFSDRAGQNPRGKRFEDKDAKREHKKAVKEENREKRREKMPKHVKKKLVSQSSRGKKK